jgi:N-acetylmuramoyl-L-alanine amidase
MVAMHRDLSKIKKIILHCSDSDLAEFDNIETIEKWHRLKGWSSIGYQYYIDRKGIVYPGRPMDQAGSHCSGHNLESIGICIGGKKVFYDAQFSALWFLIKDLMIKFKLKKSDVYPHHYFNCDKTCPNFELSKIWKYDNNEYS